MTTLAERPVAPAHALPPGEPDPGGTRQTGKRLLLVAGLVVIGVAHALNLAGWPRYFDDEGTYYSQAWAVEHLGSLAPYTYWYDHPPAGWLQMAALQWLPDLVFPDAN